MWSVMLWGPAFAGMTKLGRSRQQDSGSDWTAAKKLPGIHFGLACTLDAERAKGIFSACNGKLIVKRCSGVSRLFHYLRFQHLDPLAVQFKPRTGEGSETANFAFDRCSGLRPVDFRLGLIDLGGVGGFAVVLWDGGVCFSDHVMFRP